MSFGGNILAQASERKSLGCSARPEPRIRGDTILPDDGVAIGAKGSGLLVDPIWTHGFRSLPGTPNVLNDRFDIGGLISWVCQSAPASHVLFMA